MDVEDIFAAVITGEFPGVFGIWLFGSKAAACATAGSDVDLAVLLPAAADKVKLWNCAQTLAARIGMDVDLIDLSDASTVFRKQIIETGKRIFCSDKFACDLFETEALSDYLRFQEERKELIEDIHSRGKVLGDDR